MKNLLSKISCLILIILLGSLLRFYRLDSIPAGLHYDEAQAGYNAFSILKTGRNLNGDKYPIDIDYFGDYRPAMTSYTSIPFVKLFGLNIFSTRFSSSLFGVFLIILSYFFAQQIYNKCKISLLASFLVAISPMGVVFSRATSDGVIDVFFALWGGLFLIWSIKKQNYLGLITVYILWLLSYFSYQTSRVVVPLMSLPIIILSILEYKPKFKFSVLAFVPFLIYLIFPFLIMLHTPMGQGRFKQVSVFTFPEVQRDLDEQISEDGHKSNVIISRVFHNKIVGYIYDIGERYSNFFSPQTILFAISQPDRYSIPHVGAISIIELAGLIMSTSYLLSKKPRPIYYLPVILLLLAPIPSAITFEAAPNFQRAIFLVPLWQIVAGFGWVSFLSDQKKHLRLIVYAILILVLIWQFLHFLHQYIVHQPTHYFSIVSRNSEMEKVSISLREQVVSGKKIIISERTGPSIFYLFFNRLLPADTKVVKNGKYYSGSFSQDSIDYYDDECVGSKALLTNVKYDTAVIFAKCPQPTFSKVLNKFYRSDGSLASIMYDLRGLTYDSFSQRYKSASSVDLKEKVVKEFNGYFLKI